VDSTLRTVLREQMPVGQVISRKRKPEDKDSDVDEALSQRYSLAICRCIQVWGPILKAKIINQ